MTAVHVVAIDVIGDADAFGRACCDPTIAWDPSGQPVPVVDRVRRAAYPTVLPMLLSTDAGDTWTLLARIKPPAAAAPTPRAAARAVLASDGGPRDDEEDRGPGFLDQPTITTGLGRYGRSGTTTDRCRRSAPASMASARSSRSRRCATFPAGTTAPSATWRSAQAAPWRRCARRIRTGSTPSGRSSGSRSTPTGCGPAGSAMRTWWPGPTSRCSSRSGRNACAPSMRRSGSRGSATVPIAAAW